MDRWMNKIYSNVCRDAAWFVQIRPRTNYWFSSHPLRGNCYPNRVRHQDLIKRARGILALAWIIHNQASTWGPLLITSSESKNSCQNSPSRHAYVTLRVYDIYIDLPQGRDIQEKIKWKSIWNLDRNKNPFKPDCRWLPICGWGGRMDPQMSI